MVQHTGTAGTGTAKQYRNLYRLHRLAFVEMVSEQPILRMLWNENRI